MLQQGKNLMSCPVIYYPAPPQSIESRPGHMYTAGWRSVVELAALAQAETWQRSLLGSFHQKYVTWRRTPPGSRFCKWPLLVASTPIEGIEGGMCQGAFANTTHLYGINHASEATFVKSLMQHHGKLRGVTRRDAGYDTHRQGGINATKLS